MAIPVIGLGAGGHAKVVIEILSFQNKYEIVGLLDKNPNLKDTIIAGVPILGTDTRLMELRNQGIEYFFIGIGGAENLSVRRRLYEFALGCAMKPVQSVHPHATISPSVDLGEGITIMAKAVINPDAKIGYNAIINTGAIIEHDSNIGAHAHIAPGAIICGGVTVDFETFIGAGAIIRPYIRIGSRTIVGAGAVVTKDIDSGITVVGMPAKPLVIKHSIS